MLSGQTRTWYSTPTRKTSGILSSLSDGPTLHIGPVSNAKILRPERSSNLKEYMVVIDEVTGGEIANIVRGYIEVAGQKIRFSGIAYGRYGGQNVAPRLSPVAKKKLKGIFGDVSKFEEDLQMRLVGGQFEVRPKGGLKPSL